MLDTTPKKSPLGKRGQGRRPTKGQVSVVTYYNHTPKRPQNKGFLEPPADQSPVYLSTPEELRSQADRLELQAQQARCLANVLDCEADRAISLVQYLRIAADIAESGEA
jgi:hypothetical protein